MYDRKFRDTSALESDSTATHLPDDTTSDGRARLQGRGGAGNYVSGTNAPHQMTKEPLTGKPGAEEVGRRAELDVEAGLKRPEKAYLGSKEAEKSAPNEGG